MSLYVIKFILKYIVVLFALKQIIIIQMKHCLNINFNYITFKLIKSLMRNTSCLLK